ncbi:MAG: DNA polymerase III subunit alpha, partial [Alphaproteobacteria bacterium]|nr:DNA polymerase III subunit alpha [Alphaproteobacteria bacterium]
NVGAHAMRDLVAERDSKGPFADIADFAGRIDPRALNRRQLESLVCAGAFDSLTPNRRQLLDGLDGVLRHAAAAASERESQQVNLFGSGAARTIRLQLAAAEDWPSAERLQREYESIGFYLSAHPLDAYAAALQREGVVRSTDLQRRAQAGDGALKLAGIPVKLQERTSAKGNRFAFLQLSDQGGVFEVLVFSDMLATARDLAQAGKPLLIVAAARVEEDAVKLTVQRLEPLESVAARRSGGLRIFLRDPAGLPALKARLLQEKRGAGKIRLVLDLRAARRPTASAAAPAEDVPEEIEASLPDGYAVTPALRASLKALPGIVDVHEL